MKAKLAHKVIIAIAIPVIFQIGFLGMLLRSVEQLDQLEKAERESSDVLVLRNRMCVAEAFVFLAITRFTEFRARTNTKKKVFELQDMHTDAFKSIYKKWKNDGVKREILLDQWRYVQLARMAFRMTLNMPRAISLRDFFGPSSSNAGMAMLSYDRGNLGRLFEGLERSQAKLLKESQDKESDIKHEILAALLASLCVSLGVGWLFSRNIAVRLRNVVRNIKAMEKQEELQSVGGDDEISALNEAVIDTQLGGFERLNSFRRRRQALLRKNSSDH